jgi:hypothetical protein
MAGHIRERSPGSFVELRYSLGTDPATGKRKIATLLAMVRPKGLVTARPMMANFVQAVPKRYGACHSREHVERYDEPT